MNVSVSSLQATLSSLGSARIRPAGPEESVAGVHPQVVIEPGTEKEVAAVLALANREGLKVLPRGGGTQLALGFPPTGGDIILSLARLDGIVEHSPHDLTVTVRAGMRLRDLQAHLATTRQELALDAVLAPEATIGGIIATNPSGARRLRFGGVRDQIIGVRVALADGTLAKGGGKVVKNVAGYDLPKLFTGSLGTLGVIVAASFRLYPLPSVTRTVCLRADWHPPLCDLVLKALASVLVPTAMDIARDPQTGGCWLAVRFESGVKASVEDQAAKLLEMAGDLAASAETLEGDAEAEHWRRADALLARDAAAEESLLLKASLLPTEVAGWLERLEVVGRGLELHPRYRAHAGHGIVYARLVGAAEAMSQAIRALREDAQRTRGSLVVLECAPDFAQRVDVWGPSAALDVMRRMKNSFDPQGTLNPGRFVGGI